MVNMALWIKSNRFKLDQVQNFYPSPLANATTMYYTEKNPLNKVSRQGGDVFVVKGRVVVACTRRCAITIRPAGR
jgi:radical SAM superfamily enzyme YgiQ (UPF0313 family)